MRLVHEVEKIFLVAVTSGMLVLFISDDSQSRPCGLSIKKLAGTEETNNHVTCSEHFKVNVWFSFRLTF
jgi:hypothetical protein